MILDHAYIAVVKVIGNISGTSIPVQKVSDDMPLPSDTQYAKLLNTTNNNSVNPPSIGSYGVVIFRNKADKSNCYWIGGIPENSMIETDHKQSLATDKSAVSVKDDSVLLKANDAIFYHSSQMTEITNKDYGLQLSKQSFTTSLLHPDDKNNSEASFEISRDQNSLYTTGHTLVRSQADINLISQSGNIIISGTRTADTQYNPARRIHLTGNSIDLHTKGGQIDLEAGKMRINLSDSRTSADIPGTGGSIGFDLNILSGDISATTKLGNIFIHNLNYGAIGVIKLTNGSILSPTTLLETSLTLAIKSAKLSQITLPGVVESSLTLDTGKSHLKSTRGIYNEAIAGNIEFMTNLDLLIEAKLNAKVNAMKIEIISKLETKLKSITTIIETDKLNITAKMSAIKSQMTKMEGSLLDIKKVATIDAGPKSVAPTGSGPFCAIPTCPFTGGLHTGEKASG